MPRTGLLSVCSFLLIFQGQILEKLLENPWNNFEPNAYAVALTPGWLLSRNLFSFCNFLPIFRVWLKRLQDNPWNNVEANAYTVALRNWYPLPIGSVHSRSPFATFFPYSKSNFLENPWNNFEPNAYAVALTQDKLKIQKSQLSSHVQSWTLETTLRWTVKPSRWGTDIHFRLGPFVRTQICSPSHVLSRLETMLSRTLLQPPNFKTLPQSPKPRFRSTIHRLGFSCVLSNKDRRPVALRLTPETQWTWKTLLGSLLDAETIVLYTRESHAVGDGLCYFR